MPIANEAALLSLQRRFCKLNHCQFLQKDKLLKTYLDIQKDNTNPRWDILNTLQMKNVRSQSGIAVVSVLTKPFPCPGECLYCPNEQGVPKSYLSGEPAVMRAQACHFHPYAQVFTRLKALKDTGHIIDKVSIRIIGGTWSSYPAMYQNWFIRQLYKAASEFDGERLKDNDLKSLQLINEKAKSRIVELSVETRQDMIKYDDLLRYRKYGITKVELGVQSLNDHVLTLNRRGHKVAATAKATKLLKDFGFKVSYQMMLNLYGSDYQTDLAVFKNLFENSTYKPDHLKIYPLAVIKDSEMAKIAQKSKHHIYGKTELIGLIADIKKLIPEYCRVERVIRDIPSDRIVSGGAMTSNLRQEVAKELEKRGYKCKCIRCREVKKIKSLEKVELKILSYKASGVKEYFISFEDSIQDKLVGFCRLRLNKKTSNKTLDHAAIIREIHVYGSTVAIGDTNPEAFQHQGWGKKLISEVESIAGKNGYHKIAVIAGVGVRGYFRKLGYDLNQSYMTKNI